MKWQYNWTSNLNWEKKIINIRQIREVFSQFKTLYKNLEAEKEEAHRKATVMTPSANKPATSSGNENPAETVIKAGIADPEKDEGVGEVDGSGFGIGMVSSLN